MFLTGMVIRSSRFGYCRNLSVSISLDILSSTAPPTPLTLSRSKVIRFVLD